MPSVPIPVPFSFGRRKSGFSMAFAAALSLRTLGGGVGVLNAF
jgi:hypothetical protein